jgi:hypothetical protein
MAALGPGSGRWGPVPGTRPPRYLRLLSADQPSEDGRRGRLKNGAPGGDPSAAPRCGAHTRSGTECRSPAMENGRCRMHGGASSGPRTPEGRQRSRAAHTTHGFWTPQERAMRASCNELLAETRQRMRLFNKFCAEMRQASQPSGEPGTRPRMPSDKPG